MKRIVVLVLSVLFILSTVFVDGSKAEAVESVAVATAELVLEESPVGYVTAWLVPVILLIAVIMAAKKVKKRDAELDAEKKPLNDLANMKSDRPRTNLCSHCGVQNDDDDLFCVSCGKKLSNE